jgi:hypothetical protein
LRIVIITTKFSFILILNTWSTLQRKHLFEKSQIEIHRTNQFKRRLGLQWWNMSPCFIALPSSTVSRFEIWGPSSPTSIKEKKRPTLWQHEINATTHQWWVKYHHHYYYLIIIVLSKRCVYLVVEFRMKFTFKW